MVDCMGLTAPATQRLPGVMRLIVSLLCLLAIGCSAASSLPAELPVTLPTDLSTGSLPPPGTAWVIFADDTVHAEVASSPEQRRRGLMGREELPDGTGMLFVFPEREERFVWMKDTPLALDIAFLDDKSRVAAIRQLVPLDETLVESGVATALVLEVPRGWFDRHDVEVGSLARVVFSAGLTVR